MSRHFLKYWLYSTVEAELASEDPLLDFSASDQYNRVSAEDTIWFVTAMPRNMRLFLFGRMHVGWTGRREDAARLLGRSVDELWDASYCVIPYPHSAEMYDLIDITGIADDLRFISPTGKDRLPAQNHAQALQAMRVLTPESVALLDDAWSGSYNDLGAPASENSEDITAANFHRRQKEAARAFSTRAQSEARRRSKAGVQADTWALIL